MRLEADRVPAIAGYLAKRLRIGVPELAEGVVRVANANMERAIRVVSVERGHDPRQFALLAFGGAGGMHACEIAARLDIATVIVPRHAGVLSALGMLVADVTRDYSASVLRTADRLKSGDLDRRFAPLVAQARRELAREGYTGRSTAIERLLDVRYVGQSYEITVAYTRDYRRAFDAKHGKTYGYQDPARPVEVVNVRVVAAGVTDKPSLPFRRPRVQKARPAARRPGRFEGKTVPIAFYRWDDLPPGSNGSGAAVITGGEATIVIPPAFGFRVDGFGNVICQA